MSREFWIVYDVASGAERWRGEGNAGDAARQVVDEGLGVLSVPKAAIMGATVDLDIIRQALRAQIDDTAEAFRHRFITPGAGQAMTYQYKAAEAIAYAGDADASTPFLSAEADATGTTVASLAAIVLAQQAAWVAIGSQIEAVRMAAKAELSTAASLGALIAAGAVDWDALVSEVEG